MRLKMPGGFCSLQPDNRKLHQQLPRWLLIIGRFDEAEQECHRFLKRWPAIPGCC